jgi:hypothetical protein
MPLVSPPHSSRSCWWSTSLIRVSPGVSAGSLRDSLLDPRPCAQGFNLPALVARNP